MLRRVVKMQFRENEVENFISVFNRYRERISGQQGCREVSLLQDFHQPHIFYTYSIWENSESLEQYRNSALFAEVWPQTKKLFIAPAEAWSLFENT